jgi:hypothetical protein
MSVTNRTTVNGDRHQENVRIFKPCQRAKGVELRVERSSHRGTFSVKNSIDRTRETGVAHFGMTIVLLRKFVSWIMKLDESQHIHT